MLPLGIPIVEGVIECYSIGTAVVNENLDAPVVEERVTTFEK